MFTRFWKDDENEAAVSKQDSGRLPVNQELENASDASSPPNAEPLSAPLSATPVSDDEAREQGDQSVAEVAPPVASGEAEVIGDVLDRLREYGSNHTPDEVDDFQGLTLDCVELSSTDDLDIDVQPIDAELEASPAELEAAAMPKRIMFGRKKSGRRLVKNGEKTKTVVTPEQRLLLLDTWRRSGLSATDFAAMVGVSKHSLYKWKKLFTDFGPQGLMDQPRSRKGQSKLSELTKRAILMMKESNPDWGCQRISDMLARGPALPASASTVARVLKEAGYRTVTQPTRVHPQRVRRFERAKPNQLWQTDLFTFVLKRQNRRLYLVAFMDDHSRFIVSFGLTASATTAQVIEILEAGIASHGVPEEVLTDNGPQYVTWRGKSRFTKHLEKRGIKQLIARPKRPQTLGKVERFWGTLWRELLESTIFTDLEDARRRIAFFIDYYNFSRVHRGIDGMVPADRFYHAAPDVLRTLKERVAANALELARHGAPRKPFYVTGQVDGQSFSVHSEGERLILRRDGEDRQEVELTSPPQGDYDQELPVDPLCANGSLPSAPGEPAELPPLLPGESIIPLDPEAEDSVDDNQDAEDLPAEDGEGGAA